MGNATHITACKYHCERTCMLVYKSYLEPLFFLNKPTLMLRICAANSALM